MIKLLVVDDDASIRRMLTLALAADDIWLELAEDGPTALALAEQLDPDVVLLDVELAGMSGHDVCRALRAHARPNLASAGIVLMSGQLKGHSAGQVGADRVVGKPFKINEMRAMVRALHGEVLLRRQP